jgi:hypothetical protein
MLSNRIIKRKISAIFTAAALMLAPCGSLSATALDEVQAAVPETQLFDADGGTPVQKDTCVLTLSSEVDTVAPGGTFTVFINLDSNPGINGLVFDVVFDSNVLELRRKGKDKTFFEGSPHEPMYNEINDSDVRYLWASATLVDANGNDVVYYSEGQLGKLVFNVKDKAALGSTKISVIRDSMKVVRSLGSNEQRYNNVDVPFIVNECSVDVAEAKDISAAEVVLEESEFVYTGEAYTPAVTVADNGKTLAEGVDYTVSYENNVNAGKASVILTGMGDYAGSVTKTFEIKPRSLSEAILKLSNKSYKYDGTEKTPEVTVNDDEEKLVLGTDFTVSFGNNIEVGTAWVIVTGKGNYTGVFTLKFRITEFVTGSLNNDDNLDVEDLVLMQKMAAGWNMGIDSDLADLDGNDEFDINDLILMQKKIAGWNVNFA